MNGNNLVEPENSKIEFGDFQTPVFFADEICAYLKNDLVLSPDIILEPTCGMGNFLVSAQKIFNLKESYGIELNENYLNMAKNRVDVYTKLYNEDLFVFDFRKIKDNMTMADKLLIIGNPPWVNNSILSSLKSENIPFKSNFKGLKGLDALTGSSNFDICEYMFLQLIDAFKNTNTTIALLCKTIVARNTFKELKRNKVNFNTCRMITFDAKKIFNVSVDACLFIIGLTKEDTNLDVCEVYDIENREQPVSVFGYKNDKFYSCLSEESTDIDGHCCFEWRQGIKHDCSKIMELTKTSEGYINGNKEKINIEETLVYPLIKSSHIKSPIISNYKKYVIVTQKKVREDTTFISSIAPNTWSYLNNNVNYFNKRKSSIYNNSPQFSMFGIGEYSYSKYKVGISGFYKLPTFVLLANEKPVMMDDTCYFLSFDNYDDAYVAMLILNSNLVQSFLKSIAFLDSKRPYTKKVLERLDFNKIIPHISLNDLQNMELKFKLTPYVNMQILNNFAKTIKEMDN